MRLRTLRRRVTTCISSGGSCQRRPRSRCSNGGLETSVAIKRLLGQTDRQIKLMLSMAALLVFDTPSNCR